MVIRKTAFVLCLAGVFSTAQAGPVIEIFTKEPVPPDRIETAEAEGAQVRVYDLGATDRIKAEVHAHLNAAGLPSDPEQAKRIARNRAQSLEMESIRRRLAAASEAQARARGYGLEKIPAAVVYGRAVLYGVSDPMRALHEWRQAAGEDRR